jgi:integrase
LEDSRANTGKKISNKPLPVEDPPSEIWKTHLPASRRHLPLEKAYSGEYEYVLNRIKNHLPELYKGQVGTSIPDEKIDKILGLLRQHSKGQHCVLKRTNYFIDVLAEGKNKLGWELTVPAKSIVLPKAENRARPIMMENIHKFRSLEKEFASDLESFHKDLNHRYGQILLSAIMYGGINHCGWADAFVRALKHGNIYKHGNMVWLDLWDKEIPQHDLEKWNLQRSAEEYRRWIADPVTKLLLAREYKNNYQNNFSEKLSLKHFFHKYISPLAERAGLTLKNPKELMSMATARANICVPPFIAAYNENKSISSSLPDPAFMRLLTGNHYPSPIQLQKRKSKSQFNAGSSSRSVEHQQKLIKKLRTLIRDNFNSSNNKIRGLLANFKDQHIHEMNSACTFLVEWAIQLLDERISIHENRQRKPEKASTVFGYIGSIYWEILSVAEDLDITELDEEEFEAFLQTLTHRITGIKDYDNLEISNSAINSIERMNQFLGFLHVFYDVPKFKIELDSKNVSIKQPNVVRANLVTFQEFVRLKQRFHWTQLQRLERPRIDSIAVIWAILAFRTGMRIGEIEGLLICDFQGTDKSETLVRRNEFRVLKSDSSKRRIPLHWFVPADELVLLKKWVDMRKNEHGSTPYSPLFTSKALQYEPVTRNEILPKLSPALKEITGDQTVVFHTLRHSFASWMVLRLAIPYFDSIEESPVFLQADELSNCRCQRLRKEILGEESCGKQLLFAVAQHLGHSDTETLMASYVHIMDYLSYAYLSRKNSIPNLPAASIAVITETSCSNAYDISKDKKLGTFEANLQGIPTHPLEAKSICVFR